ncbi:MAG: hypothetical protein QXI19_13785, partial [Candidatus Caldarchaeum sp.]
MGYFEVTGAVMERLRWFLRKLFVGELEEEDRLYRASLASSLCKVLIFIMVLFGFTENLSGGNGAASFHFVSAIFFALSLFLLRKHFNLISNLVIVVIFLLYLTS